MVHGGWSMVGIMAMSWAGAARLTGGLSPRGGVSWTENRSRKVLYRLQLPNTLTFAKVYVLR